MFNILEIWLRLYKKDAGNLAVIIKKDASNLVEICNKRGW